MLSEIPPLARSTLTLLKPKIPFLWPVREIWFSQLIRVWPAKELRFLTHRLQVIAAVLVWLKQEVCLPAMSSRPGLIRWNLRRPTRLEIPPFVVLILFFNRPIRFHLHVPIILLFLLTRKCAKPL